MTDLLKPDVAAFQEAAAEARESLQSDPHRPQYHFTAPKHWLNDPNGLIQWKGDYHLFYQHNPYNSLSATKHWGHAVSSDLVHWRDLPIALAPEASSPDADGIYSGCAVHDNGTPTILYSGVLWPRQMVCLATGDDQLVSWTKDPGNPIIPDYPDGVDILQTDDGRIHYRDPNVWREGDEWRMIVGSGLPGRGGTVFQYRSDNLRDWKSMGPLLVGDMNQFDPVWTGTMWECPQLFPLNGKHVLMISVWHERKTLYPAYMTGTYDGERFLPEYVGVIDPGSHYAPQTMADDQGRRILFGWLREQRSPEAMAASDWNGAMTIPWLLSLAPDGSLRYEPAPELEALREHHQRFSSLNLDASSQAPLQGVSGSALELQATIAVESAAVVGLSVRRSPDGSEATDILYNREADTIVIDRHHASLDPEAETTLHEVKVGLADEELLHLTVFLDHSIVEVLANNRVLLSERIYPTRSDSIGVATICSGGTATVQTLDVWNMQSSWS